MIFSLAWATVSEGASGMVLGSVSVSGSIPLVASETGSESASGVVSEVISGTVSSVTSKAGGRSFVET